MDRRSLLHGAARSTAHMDARAERVQGLGLLARDRTDRPRGRIPPSHVHLFMRRRTRNIRSPKRDAIGVRQLSDETDVCRSAVTNAEARPISAVDWRRRDRWPSGRRMARCSIADGPRGNRTWIIHRTQRAARAASEMPLQADSPSGSALKFHLAFVFGRRVSASFPWFGRKIDRIRDPAV